MASEVCKVKALLLLQNYLDSTEQFRWYGQIPDMDSRTLRKLLKDSDARIGFINKLASDNEYGGLEFAQTQWRIIFDTIFMKAKS